MRKDQGITYLALLFIVALSGVALAGAGVLWSFERQREKERELLFIGGQFRDAIRGYYERSPGLVKRFPARLEDLLQDHRFLGVQRHLRQIYVDPMTGTPHWGLIQAPEGGIMGVVSTATGRTIKRAGFGEAAPELEGKERYDEWRFMYRPILGTK